MTKKKEKKKPTEAGKKEKKKESTFPRRAVVAVKVFESKILPAGWRFFIQNPKGLTLTANAGRMWEPALPLLFFFIFKELAESPSQGIRMLFRLTGIVEAEAVPQMGQNTAGLPLLRGGKSKGVNGLNEANSKGWNGAAL